MAVEVHITETMSDYYIEAYTKDYKINEDKTIEDIGITRLAYVSGYRDFDIEESEQLASWLELRDTLKKIYSTYPDGEVTVKLVIKDEWINCI